MLTTHSDHQSKNKAVTVSNSHDLRFNRVETGIQTVLVFLRLFCSNGLQAFIPSQEESFNQILALSDEIDY